MKLKKRKKFKIKTKKEVLKQMRKDGSKNPEEELVKPNWQVMKYLEDENLLEIIDKEFDKRVVREHEARKVIFLVTNMRNVDNLNKATDNLIVNAISGTGKDHISEAVFEIIEESEKEELVKTTPKVLSYTRNKKIDKEATWIKSALRLEDASNSLVNDESFKVFLSANPKKINYGKTVNRGKVIEIAIEGKPSIIMTIANPEIKNEQLRRLPMLFLDEGINQTKEILKRQAEYAKKGIPLEYNPNLITAVSYLKRRKVKIPYADKLVPIFENSLGNVIVRTAFPRFLDYIKSSTVLFQYQRKIDKEGYIIATEKDFENGCLCLRKTTSNLLMIPLNKLDNDIYNIFKTKKFQEISIEDLMDFPEIQQLGKSDRWIRFRLDFLVSKSFLKRISKKVDWSNKPVYFYSYNEIAEFKIPSFKELHKITSNTSNTIHNSNTSNTSNTKNKGVFEVFEPFETLSQLSKNGKTSDFQPKGIDSHLNINIKEFDKTPINPQDFKG
jgi:hypothetical protein